MTLSGSKFDLTHTSYTHVEQTHICDSNSLQSQVGEKSPAKLTVVGACCIHVDICLHWWGCVVSYTGETVKYDLGSRAEGKSFLHQQNVQSILLYNRTAPVKGIFLYITFLDYFYCFTTL